MAGNKFLELTAGGALAEVVSNDASAGAGDAGKLVALDTTGKLDQTMMPVGLIPDLANFVSFENLAAGDYVNIFLDAAVAKVRKADATTVGKEADGFVLAAVTAPATVDVYFEGSNTQVTGMTIGATVFLQTTAGAGGSTVPSAAGNVVQKIGRAISATSVSFEPALPVTLA